MAAFAGRHLPRKEPPSTGRDSDLARAVLQDEREICDVRVRPLPCSHCEIHPRWPPPQQEPCPPEKSGRGPARTQLCSRKSWVARRRRIARQSGDARRRRFPQTTIRISEGVARTSQPATTKTPSVLSSYVASTQPSHSVALIGMGPVGHCDASMSIVKVPGRSILKVTSPILRTPIAES